MVEISKVFHCSSCGGNTKGQLALNDIAESTSSDTHSTQSVNENTNSEILNALNAVSYRLMAID